MCLFLVKGRLHQYKKYWFSAVLTTYTYNNTMTTITHNYIAKVLYNVFNCSTFLLNCSIFLGFFLLFSPTSAAQVLVSWFYRSYLWAPFLSPLPCRWRFAVCALWLQCETRVSTELAGRFLHYSLLGTLPNMFEKLKAKQRVVIYHEKAAHPLYIDKWGVCSNNWMFRIVCNA